METLTRALYINVNKLKYYMFLKKYQKPYKYTEYFKWHGHELTTTLPFGPRDYIQRLNYQVFVWIHSHENKQYLPGREKSGWKINGEEIKYDWVKGNLIIPEKLVNILCKQNVEGVHIRIWIMKMVMMMKVLR